MNKDYQQNDLLSINDHTTSHRPLVIIWHLRVLDPNIVRVDLPSSKVRHESLSEIVQTDKGVDDGDDDEDQGDDGEGGERSSNGNVLFFLTRLIHPDELEQEICQSGKVDELIKG